jgi:hypothetical protein
MIKSNIKLVYDLFVCEIRDFLNHLISKVY